MPSSVLFKTVRKPITSLQTDKPTNSFCSVEEKWLMYSLFLVLYAVYRTSLFFTNDCDLFVSL
jgi:hypothetical protein